MITLQRARDRPKAIAGGHGVAADEPFASLRGCFEQLTADPLGPLESVTRHMARGAEVVIYVFEGNVDFDDGLGHTASLLAGDFVRLSAVQATEIVVANPRDDETARVYQVHFGPSATGIGELIERRRFTAADRERLCLVATSEHQAGAMHLRHDAAVHSGRLQRGQHVVHELSTGRVAWVQVVQGNVSVSGTSLLAGDRMCVSRQRTASFTAQQHSEVLVVDVATPTVVGEE